VRDGGGKSGSVVYDAKYKRRVTMYFALRLSERWAYAMQIRTLAPTLISNPSFIALE
jgi:hypothetical protein